MSCTNGTAALQFPSSYVLMSEEEMEYVDGGKVTYYKYGKGSKTGVNDLFRAAGLMASIAGLSWIISRASTKLLVLNPGLGVAFKCIFKVSTAYASYLAEQFLSAGIDAEGIYKRRSYEVAVNSIIGIKYGVSVV